MAKISKVNEYLCMKQVQRKKVFEEFIKENDPWDRMKPWESCTYHHYFNEYKNMNPSSRSIQAVCDKFNLKRTGMGGYSTVYHWKIRAEAWDEHLRKVDNLSKIQAIKQMNLEQAAKAKALQNTLIAPTKTLVKKIQNAEKASIDLFEDMTVEELYERIIQSARVFPNIADMERKARGEPVTVEKVNMNLTSSDGSMTPIINFQVLGSKSPLLEKIAAQLNQSQIANEPDETPPALSDELFVLDEPNEIDE